MNKNEEKQKKALALINQGSKPAGDTAPDEGLGSGQAICIHYDVPSRV